VNDAAPCDHVMVWTTVDDASAAESIAAGLVEESLAACVQRIAIESTYRWKGKIENAKEFLLLAKTKSQLAPKVAEFIRARHPYELPEIVTTPIVDGLKPYLQWISDETR